jgi:hypothetical protein
MQSSLNIVNTVRQAPALRTRLVGEAKILRAFMYFTLLKRLAEYL